jgi:hypothetical protein
MGFDGKHGAGLNHDKIDQRLPIKENRYRKDVDEWIWSASLLH